MLRKVTEERKEANEKTAIECDTNFLIIALAMKFYRWCQIFFIKVVISLEIIARFFCLWIVVSISCEYIELLSPIGVAFA